MAGMRLSVMQEKGQVTIPQEVRTKLGLKKGDRVSFIETDQGIIIKPAEVIVGDALEEIGNALKAKGLRLEDVIERGRNIRGEISKRRNRPARNKRA